jgi:hypothetical protein
MMKEEQMQCTESKPLEDKDIQRILQLDKAGKSAQYIADELHIPCWAVLLILTLYT